MKLLLIFPLLLFFVSCGNHSSKPGYSYDSQKFQLADPNETSVKVSLWDQKAWLLNGRGEPILETDVATGVPGKETPTGVFPVLERLADKRSNLYGQYVDKVSRKVVVDQSWKHQGDPPAGTEYQGISMPYWMRLTWDGVGMHVGKFKKRTRCSFGCIRVFRDAQPMIYQKTKLGTKIEVVAESLLGRYSKKSS